MKASEGKLGRVFVVRLDEGESPAWTLERFATEKGIASAQVFVVAASAVVGIIAPDADGRPKLRLAAGTTVSDDDYRDGEIIIQEVLGLQFRRVVDPASGKETLSPVTATRTRGMEKPAPLPAEAGPGTIPVYLFNAVFN